MYRSWAFLSLALLFTACSNTPQQAPIAKQEVMTGPVVEVKRTCEPETPEEQNRLTVEPKELDLWARMRAGFTLDTDITHSRITSFEKYYSSNQDYMDRVTQRGQRYWYYIVDELEQAGLPLELALLPIVESAFDPYAYSHGRASGIWQFIPATGKSFGLKQTWWYDGRRDIRASTGAAIKYLTYLHEEFDGDWLLALAAYNTGEGNVRKSVRRNKKRGKPTDFWSLKLPRETRSYVPQLIALAKLVKEPTKYNIQLQPLLNEPYFASVDVGSQIDITQAAELAEISTDEMYWLNPAFNRWASDPTGPHELLIPIDHVELFTSRLNTLVSEERVTWINYKIRRGDTLSTIAKRHHLTTEQLKSHNNIKNNFIREGKTLLIPSMSVAGASKENPHTYHAKRKAKIPSGKVKVTHRVRKGESLWLISRSYRVNVKDLAEWNGLALKDPIRIGQKLTVWQSGVTIASKDSSDRSVRKIQYRVRRGDSLHRIAGKFNLKVNDILRWNSINSQDYLKPGQSLTLFVDVRRLVN